MQNSSLRQFARMAGVSPATVSRVFSDQAELVAPETRDRLIALADSCGFRPSAIGRVSFGGKSNSVGVVLPGLAISYFAHFACGLQRALLQSNILPMILQSDNDGDRRAVQRLLDHRVDAMVLILTDETLNQAAFSDIVRAKLPLLLVGPTRAGLIGDSVDTDDFSGGFQAGQHLLAKGHRRFGFCYFGEGYSSSDERLKGFESALHKAGVSLAPEDIAHLPPHAPTHEAAIQQLNDEIEAILTRPQRPTAFFASTDLLALQVYKVARALSIRIPQDLSVVGFADLDFAPHVDPPLSTIRQNGEALGLRAGEILLQRLADPTAPRKHEVLSVELIERDSTAMCI